MSIESVVGSALPIKHLINSEVSAVIIPSSQMRKRRLRDLVTCHVQITMK